MCKRFFIILLALLSVSCSKLDDYMLGKDNTPSPTALEPINSAKNEALKENWSVSAGNAKRNTSYLKLKPAILGSVIYTADATGSIQATEKDSGKFLWTKKLAAGVISGPTISANTLVVATDNSKIVALSQTDGHELWQSSISSDALAKPVIAKSKVLAKTIDGNLYALDLKTGKQLWLSQHGAPSLILKASSSPVVVNSNMIIVGYSDGKMDAVNIDSGQLIWQRSIAFANGSSDVERLVDIDADPIVEGDLVLLASYQGYVGALSLANGQFIWRKPASTFTNIVVGGDNLYMTDSNDIVWSINKKSGQVNWKQVNLKARGLTEPVLMGNRLIIGDKTGVLHTLSAKSGDFIARNVLSGPIQIPPTVVGSSVFILTSNGKLSRLSVG